MPGMGPAGGAGGGGGGGGVAGADFGTSEVQQSSRHSGAHPCGQEAGQRPPDAAWAAAAAFPVSAERGIDISGRGAGGSPGFSEVYCEGGKGMTTVPGGSLVWS